jgi:hypothetical protein
MALNLGMGNLRTSDNHPCAQPTHSSRCSVQSDDVFVVHATLSLGYHPLEFFVARIRPVKLHVQDTTGSDDDLGNASQDPYHLHDLSLV